MADLEFCPKHNMVAYLEKTDGNTKFHQIMDFLTGSSIYYALTLVTILEASIRSDLLFDDADGIDSLYNQAIFDNIQLMGSKSTFWDQIPTNIATAGKNFSRKVTPLFDSMLVQQTEDEGDASKRPSDSPPIPSPPHPSEDQPQIQPGPSPRPSPTTHIPDSILEGSGGNHRGQSSNNASLSRNEDGQEAKEKSQTTYYTSQSLDEDKIGKEDFSKEKGGYTRSMYLNRGGNLSKTFKGEPSVHKDPAFDDLDDFVDVDDTLDYMETKDVQDERSNEGTDKGNEGTDKQDRGTDSTKVSTDRQGKGTADQNEGKSVTQTPTLITPTPTVFGDDETIAQVLIIMSQNKEKLKEKEKGVEIRNVEETERPRPTSTRSILTLRPLPKIDPKDKGKKRIEEEDGSDTESEGITKAEKKFKQLANDEEVARKVRLNADKIHAEKLQEEEREIYTIEQRTKFLHDTIATQRRFLAQQRSEAIRNKPPSRNQLRNQMMTYLKHVGGKKHSDLKKKSFDEIQVLYEKIKRSDDSFIAIGSAEDEKVIKEMNEQAADASKKNDDSDDEHKKCLRIVTFKGTIDSEIMEKKSFIARLHKVSSPDGNYLVVYRVNGHFRAFNYLMEVLHIFDRQDLFHLYDLVMKQYLKITPKDIELILWGDLKIMMESSTEENDQELKDGTIIYMLVERRYPLSKELLQQMIDLGLEVGEESTVALQLVRFIKQQLNEE
ncbi:hypothetical protein Tco_0386001 [Tanacetum coccineum]